MGRFNQGDKLNAKIHFYKDAAGEWRWTVQAANNEIIGASSEGFKNFLDCKTNLLLLILACTDCIGTIALSGVTEPETTPVHSIATPFAEPSPKENT